jgi:phage-related tail fiber protein
LTLFPPRPPRPIQAAAATPAPAASRREATLAAANKAFAPSVPFTPAVRITQGSHGGMGMVAATPGGMLLTGARAPRNGEVFYSQNGQRPSPHSHETPRHD